MKNHNFFGFNSVETKNTNQNTIDILIEIESFFDKKSFETSMDFIETKI